MMRTRPEPCEGCPYRRDVPSGVWTREEYDKLEQYDNETWCQPFAWFGCHAAPNLACHGWSVVHGRQQGTHACLAMRAFDIEPPARTDVPLWDSGTQAARHGRARIKNPGKRAIEMVARLLGKHTRLRENEHNAVLLEEDR